MALGASLDLLLSFGIDAIWLRLCEVNDQLRQFTRLTPRGLGKAERHIAGKIAVLLVARSFDVRPDVAHFGQQTIGLQRGDSAREQRLEGMFQVMPSVSSNKARILHQGAVVCRFD